MPRRKPSSRRRRAGTVRIAAHSDRVRRSATELQQTSSVKLAMLAYVRDRLRAWESADFRIPTTVVDQVLDELNSLELETGV